MSACTERRQGRANTWSVSLRATPLATGPRCSHRGGNKRRRSNATHTLRERGAERGGEEERRKKKKKKKRGEVRCISGKPMNSGQKLPLFFQRFSDQDVFICTDQKPCGGDINIVRETLLTGLFQAKTG